MRRRPSGSGQRGHGWQMASGPQTRGCPLGAVCFLDPGRPVESARAAGETPTLPRREPGPRMRSSPSKRWSRVQHWPPGSGPAVSCTSLPLRSTTATLRGCDLGFLWAEAPGGEGAASCSPSALPLLPSEGTWFSRAQWEGGPRAWMVSGRESSHRASLQRRQAARPGASQPWGSPERWACPTATMSPRLCPPGPKGTWQEGL